MAQVARGADLTGRAASLFILVFAVAHAADRDPWQRPAVFMCMTIWLISFMLASWNRGYRPSDHQYERLFRDFPPPKPEPLSCFRISVEGMIGCVLALALFLAADAPFIRLGYQDAIHQARTRAFRNLSREQLHQRVLGADREGSLLAFWEFQRRGFKADDAARFAIAFGDASLSSRARRSAGRCLADCPRPHPEPIIALVAQELESNDPDIQSSAAWILGEIAPDAPTRCDSSDETRKNVILFQRWWRARRRIKEPPQPNSPAKPAQKTKDFTVGSCGS